MAISLKIKGFNTLLKDSMSVVLVASLTIVAFSLPNSALAQEGSASALLEEIVTVARKRSEAEAVQDVPVAVTVFGAEQIEALFVKKLDDLSYMMPNVQLDAVGTFPAFKISRFAVRALTARYRQLTRPLASLLTAFIWSQPTASC